MTVWLLPLLLFSLVRMHCSLEHQAWNIVETQNYLLNKWTGKTLEAFSLLFFDPSAEIRGILLRFHNELPSTLPAGMLSNGSFTKRETDRDMLLLSTIAETGKSWFLKVLTKHPKMTLNVRGFQGQSNELESPIQVSVIDLFLFCFLEFLISLCSEDPC